MSTPWQSDDATAAAAIDVAALESAYRANSTVSSVRLKRHWTASPRRSRYSGQDQTLAFYNRAYQELWKLDPAWLANAPSDADILDRLKELSLLPAMVDYRTWKTKILEVYTAAAEYEDPWQLPDGRVLQVVANQRPDGGVTYVYEDISERLALESRYNALIDVQRETLDSLNEAVAVFETDGRLKLFNTAFLAIWRVSRTAMEQGPHIGEVIAQTQVSVWRSRCLAGS